MIYEEILLYHYPEYAEEYEKKKINKLSLIDHILINANANVVIELTNFFISKYLYYKKM